MKKDNQYDQKYASQDYYWGKKPSKICDRIIEIMKPTSGFRPKLLDIGCGEGRNAIYFAKHGFNVTALDTSMPGLDKTQKYAKEVGVEVKIVHADIITYEIEDTFDVIFSTGTLHYLPPDVREQRFQHFKNSTSPRGINALSVLVGKPFIPGAPDAEENAHLFKSGELMSYYWDWEILYCEEEIFNCMSSGVPHKHAANRIIARRYSDGK